MPVIGAVGGALAGLTAKGPAKRHADRVRARSRATLAEQIAGASVANYQPYGTSIITGGTDVAFVPSTDTFNPVFRISGALPVDPHDGGGPMLTGAAVAGGETGSAITVEFSYDGAKLELRTKFQTAGVRHRVWADGILVGTAAGPTGSPDGNWYRYPITLPDARRRLIRIDTTAYSRMVGLTTEAGTSVTYPAGTLKGPRVALFGDSFIEGAVAADYFATLASRISLGMGWTDLWALGSGGTGYLATNPTFSRPKYRDRVNHITANNPDIVIVAGGINDYMFNAADVGTEAGLLFDAIRTGCPDAELLVIGPWAPYEITAWDTQQFAIRDSIKAAADARGLYFIDPAAERWITGTGRVGAPTGTGNADTFTSSDGTHPTDAGHIYLGERICGHLVSLGAISA